MTTVASRMARNVAFARELDPLSKVVDLFLERKIRHLPVLAEMETLVGIVSDRDIKRALPSPYFGQPDNWRGTFESVPIATLMTRSLVTVGPDERMEDAVRLLIKHRIGCLPVVEEGSLVGLLSETDCLRHCIEVIQTHGG